MDCHDKVDEMVREANLRLRVRRVCLVFSSASSSLRKSLSRGRKEGLPDAQGSLCRLSGNQGEGEGGC